MLVEWLFEAGTWLSLEMEKPHLACVDSLEKMRLTGDRIIVLGYQKSCHVERAGNGQET